MVKASPSRKLFRTGFESLKPTSGPSGPSRFNFRIARQNEAARAADAAAWVLSAFLIFPIR